MEKVYTRYAKIMDTLKALENERDLLKAEIIGKLKDEPEGRKETNLGNFTLAKKLVWTYTEKVKVLEDKVKIAKDKEQKKGLAKATATEYVVFTQPKEE